MNATLKRTAAMTAAMLCCTLCAAQKRYVVRDMETKTPLRGVTVIFNGIDSCRTVTDYTGTFAAPDTARTFKLKHPKYEQRMMEQPEMTDTVELLPNMNKLNEVVIRGKKRNISPEILGGAKMAAMTAPRQAATVNFDLMDLLTYKKRKKTRKRIKAIENY